MRTVRATSGGKKVRKDHFHHARRSSTWRLMRVISQIFRDLLRALAPRRSREKLSLSGRAALMMN